MSSILVLAGCPGSGKTSLARLLVAQKERGVCIEADAFYRFLAHRLDPSAPESQSQNAAVTRAFLHAARSLYEDGYDVVLEGVIGPWWLETIQHILPSCEYAILHAALETVLHRTEQRGKSAQASAHPELVRTMHRQFDALSNLQARTLNTTNKPLPTVLTEFLTRQSQNHFSLPSIPSSQ